MIWMGPLQCVGARFQANPPAALTFLIPLIIEDLPSQREFQDAFRRHCADDSQLSFSRSS